ncbi:MAG: hypothetical protein IJQ98_13130 [Oscillospiraceae bacterium]|nr:hypothetical protein [Oscillospiraceae bacterium]
MKAIILERRGDEAAVLCEDGTFAKCRVSGEVGETVELSAEVVAFPAQKKTRWARSAVAAALALTVTGGTLGYMGGTASAYVSLDVEDSAIELTVNHFGRVIAVNAVSEDAEALAESLSAEVKHQPVEKALNHTMVRLRDEGYVSSEGASVVAGVASDNTRRKEELTRTVTDAVNGQLLIVTESSRAEREQAKEQHVSVGRFGAERDHAELPDVAKQAEEQQEEATPQTEPVIPASEPVEMETQESQAEQPAREERRTGPQTDTPREQTTDRPERQEPQAQQNHEETRQELPTQGERQDDQRAEPPADDHAEQPGDLPAMQPENEAQGGENPRPQQEEQQFQEQLREEPLAQELRDGEQSKQEAQPQEPEQHDHEEQRPQESGQQQDNASPSESVTENSGRNTEERGSENAEGLRGSKDPRGSEAPGHSDAGEHGGPGGHGPM